MEKFLILLNSNLGKLLLLSDSLTIVKLTPLKNISNLAPDMPSPKDISGSLIITRLFVFEFTNGFHHFFKLFDRCFLRWQTGLAISL